VKAHFHQRMGTDMTNQELQRMNCVALDCLYVFTITGNRFVSGSPCAPTGFLASSALRQRKKWSCWNLLVSLWNCVSNSNTISLFENQVHLISQNHFSIRSIWILRSRFYFVNPSSSVSRTHDTISWFTWIRSHILEPSSSDILEYNGIASIIRSWLRIVMPVL
jgi:hypothetical protein